MMTVIGIKLPFLAAEPVWPGRHGSPSIAFPFPPSVVPPKPPPGVPPAHHPGGTHSTTRGSGERGPGWGRQRLGQRGAGIAPPPHPQPASCTQTPGCPAHPPGSCPRGCAAPGPWGPLPPPAAAGVVSGEQGGSSSIGCRARKGRWSRLLPGRAGWLARAGREEALGRAWWERGWGSGGQVPPALRSCYPPRTVPGRLRPEVPRRKGKQRGGKES